jgi:hypothetical protein
VSVALTLLACCNIDGAQRGSNGKKPASLT